MLRRGKPLPGERIGDLKETLSGKGVKAARDESTKTARPRRTFTRVKGNPVFGLMMEREIEKSAIDSTIHNGNISELLCTEVDSISYLVTISRLRK